MPAAFRDQATTQWAGSTTGTITAPGTVATNDWGLILVTNAALTATCAITTPTGWTVVQAQTDFGSGSYAVYKRQRQAGDASVVITKGDTGTPVVADAVWFSSCTGFGTAGTFTSRGGSSVTTTAVAHATGSGFTTSLALFVGKTSTTATVDAGTKISERYYGASAGHPYAVISSYTGATATRTLTSGTASTSGGGCQIAVLDIAGTPPVAVVTTTDVFIVDATASTGSGLSYAIAPTGTTPATPVPEVLSAGRWAVTQSATAILTYNVTVTGTGSLTDVEPVIVPATSGSGGLRGIKVKRSGVWE